MKAYYTTKSIQMLIRTNILADCDGPFTWTRVNYYNILTTGCSHIHMEFTCQLRWGWCYHEKYLYAYPSTTVQPPQPSSAWAAERSTESYCYQLVQWNLPRVISHMQWWSRWYGILKGYSIWHLEARKSKSNMKM